MKIWNLIDSLNGNQLVFIHQPNYIRLQVIIHSNQFYHWTNTEIDELNSYRKNQFSWSGLCISIVYYLNSLDTHRENEENFNETDVDNDWNLHQISLMLYAEYVSE